MAQFVTNGGLGMIAAALHAYTSRPRYLQWGEGSGQDATDTAIADAGNTTEARVTGTSSVETTTTTDDTYQVTGTIVAAQALSVTELGIYDGAGSGNPPTGDDMGIYGDFGVITLATGDSITFTSRTVFDQA
jgi:hypothetical protein